MRRRHLSLQCHLLVLFLTLLTPQLFSSSRSSISVTVVAAASTMSKKKNNPMMKPPLSPSPSAAPSAAPSASSSSSFFNHTHLRSKCLSQPSLICSLYPTSGFSVSGIVLFTPVYSRARPFPHKCAVLITASIESVTPVSIPHGLHIHQFGDVRDVTSAKSTGGHFKHPDNEKGEKTVHSFPYKQDRHWGDLGNILINKHGKGTYRRIDRVVKLQKIIGRSVVMHIARDKGRTEQPSGASGKRIAMGVIGIKNTEWMDDENEG